MRKSLTENTSLSGRMEKHTEQDMTYLYMEERHLRPRLVSCFTLSVFELNCGKTVDELPFLY